MKGGGKKRREIREKRKCERKPESLIQMWEEKEISADKERYPKSERVHVAWGEHPEICSDSIELSEVKADSEKIMAKAHSLWSNLL